MSIRWSSSALAFGLLTSGCGISGGELLYFLGGGGKGRKVQAEFRLSDQPILILVDDHGATITDPLFPRTFEGELAEELIKTKSAKRIIPPETLDALRQTVADFEKKGCRELGEMAGATQVVWIQIQGFYAEEVFSDASEAAFIQATVKVINVLEKENRARVRLWPVIATGTPVTATLDGPLVARLKTKPAISNELAARLARMVARFFHDHRLDPGEIGTG